jgi:hypothetical protein
MPSVRAENGCHLSHTGDPSRYFTKVRGATDGSWARSKSKSTSQMRVKVSVVSCDCSVLPVTSLWKRISTLKEAWEMLWDKIKG